MGFSLSNFIAGAGRGLSEVGGSMVKKAQESSLLQERAAIDDARQKAQNEWTEGRDDKTFARDQQGRRDDIQFEHEFKTKPENVKASANAAGLIQRAQDDNKTQTYSEGTTVIRPDGSRFTVPKTYAPDKPNYDRVPTEDGRIAIFKDGKFDSYATDSEGKPLIGAGKEAKDEYMTVGGGFDDDNKPIPKQIVRIDPKTKEATVVEPKGQRAKAMTMDEARARAEAEAEDKAGMFSSDKSDFGKDGREHWTTNRTFEITKESEQATGQGPDANTPQATFFAQQPTPPKEAFSGLQEGAQRTFKNGQVWTIKNGRPVRVE